MSHHPCASNTFAGLVAKRFHQSMSSTFPFPPSNNGTITSELSQANLSTLQHSPHLTLQFRAKKKLITEKVTQGQLSKIIKVGASSLSRWLNGLTAKMNPKYLDQLNEM